jgi:hypothetical protein
VRVLLDACVDWRLARDIVGHDVKTARQMGWTAIKNGALLTLASETFDVFVTVDRNLSFQQNLDVFSIAVVVLQAKTNRLSDLRSWYQTYWQPSRQRCQVFPSSLPPTKRLNSMRLPRNAALPACAGHLTQGGPLGRPRILEQLPLERIEGVGGGEEPEAAAVAHDDAGLNGDSNGLGPNLDDVVVGHDFPAAGFQPASLIDR